MSQRKNCTQCSKEFLIIDQEERFLEGNGWMLPSECPDCRQARRMAARDPRKLTKTTCSECGEEIIIAFERKKDVTVYCKEHYLKWLDSSDHLV
jgi:CxxC-x17-CxxC domain-containing protein